MWLCVLEKLSESFCYLVVSVVSIVLNIKMFSHNHICISQQDTKLLHNKEKNSVIDCDENNDKAVNIFIQKKANTICLIKKTFSGVSIEKIPSTLRIVWCNNTQMGYKNYIKSRWSKA